MRFHWIIRVISILVKPLVTSHLVFSNNIVISCIKGAAYEPQHRLLLLDVSGHLTGRGTKRKATFVYITRFLKFSKMKFALALACLTLAVCVQAAPGPPPVAEENLSPQCRTPKCPAKSNANLPYPMDCLLYVKCTNGKGTVVACPPDLQYNEAAGKCTGRATANCVNCWQKAPAY